MDRLLAVNAEYKRQAIEYSNRIDELEAALEKILAEEDATDAVMAEVRPKEIPFMSKIRRIAEQALKKKE